VTVTVVAFDFGETLLDETRAWERVADGAGVPRLTLMGVIGGLAARRERHSRLWEVLDVDPARNRTPWGFEFEEFYPDAFPCLERLRAAGYRVAIAGNTLQLLEKYIAPYADVVGSSERFGAEKPAPEFFTRLAAEVGREPNEIAYVGDRVDNDVEPALAAGMVAVHVRRGPWGYLHDPPPEAIAIRSLDELPGALP
jgi:FMN phosphatase YigB (HAD superfamily)